MQGNEALKARMAELGFTQSELADSVNADLRSAGYEGTVSDRTVRNWLTGNSRWPHRRQRAALEAVFNCPVAELGFTPRGDTSPRTAPSEDPVQRRHFVSATAGALLGGAATAPAHGAQPRVGSGDVQRLLSKFAVVIASDHRYGGKLTIETRASALAGETMALQARGTVSQRVRGALYGCAASFSSSAMWAAIDGRRFDTAQRHFERAASLAAMSGDSTIQFRIWSHAGSMYRHMDRPADALATNDVARRLPIARRDPLFASLGHARHAAILGLTGDARAVRQALGHAWDAFARADLNEERPLWMNGVRDQGEIEELAMSALVRLGLYEEAESHAHKSLSLLHSSMQRDRTLVTTRLAQCLLGQGAGELSLDTAKAVRQGPLADSPRVAEALNEFDQALRRTAPASNLTREWEEFCRDTEGRHDC